MPKQMSDNQLSNDNIHYCFKNSFEREYGNTKKLDMSKSTYKFAYKFYELGFINGYKQNKKTEEKTND